MFVDGIYYGPSVHEAAESLIKKNTALIESLQSEIKAARVRLKNSEFANMLEAERLATVSEPFQKQPLNNNPMEIDWEEYERRVNSLELEGLTRSDAQAVVEVEIEKERNSSKTPA